MRFFASASDRLLRQRQDEDLYAMAAAEVAHGQPSPGLLAKAYADARGDDSRAKALYLEYRVKALRTEGEAILERERAARQASSRPLPPDPVWEAIKPGRNSAHGWQMTLAIVLIFIGIVGLALIVYYGDWAAIGAAIAGLAFWLGRKKE